MVDKILTLIALFLFALTSYAQETASNEVAPYYKQCSGEQNIQKRDVCTRDLINEFFVMNFKMPVRGNLNTEAGLVEAKFMVNRKGRARDPQIIKGLDDEINQRVIDLIYSLPKFKPGTKNGKPAALPYKVSIRLYLR